MPLIQFIGAAVGVGTIAVLASIIWPRISADPRPAPLNTVHEAVIQTEQGKELENTLGVSDEQVMHPVDLGTLISNGAQGVVNQISNSAQHAVTVKLLETVSGQFEQLSDEDKETFRAQVCNPTP